MIKHTKQIFSFFSEERLSNSVLIYGRKGIGKSYFVESIAQQILQTKASPDLLILRGKPLAIDDVRRGIDFSITKAANRYKILVFDGIDNMSNSAVNAMLKLVEEPPIDMYIFLVVSNPYNIPKTISSRCIRIHLQQQKFEDFVKIVSSKRNDLSDEALRYLYDALEGDISSTYAISNDIVKVVSSGEPYLGDLLSLFATAADDSLVKIILFELAKKAKLADSQRQLYFLEKVDFLNHEYAKIKNYNLNETNALCSIVSSLDL